MSRRAVEVESQERWVFNRLADAYRFRRPYPEAIVDYLASSAGASALTLDLGAGTGDLAIPLARAGLRVTAVEPARAMLNLLIERARQTRVEVTALNAAAESTSLPSGNYQLVLLADALQWVDLELAAKEAGRLRATGGKIAILEAALGKSAFMSELDELLCSNNPRAHRKTPPVDQFYSVALPGCSVVHHDFSDVSELDQQTFRHLLRSLSFVGPALSSQQFEDLFQQALRLAHKHAGIIWRRDFTLWESTSPDRPTRP